MILYIPESITIFEKKKKRVYNATLLEKIFLKVRGTKKQESWNFLDLQSFGRHYKCVSDFQSFINLPSANLSLWSPSLELHVRSRTFIQLENLRERNEKLWPPRPGVDARQPERRLSRVPSARPLSTSGDCRFEGQWFAWPLDIFVPTRSAANCDWCPQIPHQIWTSHELPDES